MKDPLTEDERRAQAGVEGRVAFAVAALAIAAALVALIDRVGAPAQVVAILGPTVALGGLAALGLALLASRVSPFYAAGRLQQPKYAGLAMALLAVAMIPPMLPPSPEGAQPSAMLLGLACGVTLAGFAAGPLMRKSGALSPADLAGARFHSPGVRRVVGLAVALVAGLAAFAGMEGAIRGLEEHVGLTRFAAAMAAGFVLLTIVAPGGLAGSVWAATAAAFLLLAALVAPLALALWSGAPLPSPAFGRTDLWGEAMARMSQWSAAPDVGPGDFLIVTAAAAIGAAAFAPLLSPAIAIRQANAGGRAGGFAIVWFLVAVSALVVAMAVSALSLDALVVGQRPDRLPALVYIASDKGLLTICGQYVANPRAALAACGGAETFTGLLGAEHVWASGRFLATRLADLRAMSPALAGLVGAAFIAAALALAAAGLQSFATALANDVAGPAGGRPALASRRLATARLMMIALAAGIALWCAQAPRDAQSPLALALLLSATMVAPLFVLTMWPRATAGDAAFALLIGALAALAAAWTAWKGDGFHAPPMAAGAVAGFLVALAGGVLSSLRRPEVETRLGRIFVESLMHGEDEVMTADRGA